MVAEGEIGEYEVGETESDIGKLRLPRTSGCGKSFNSPSIEHWMQAMDDHPDARSGPVICFGLTAG
jgi:hypothetical protein